MNLEAHLRERFQSSPEPPPPEPEPIPFEHVIRQAYLDILRREPDELGMVHYSKLLVEGLTEATMRESMMRSDEFAENFN